jgi:hypothetical protein
MTEEEIEQAAQSDLDCPPLTCEQLMKFKRVHPLHSRKKDF